MIVSSKYIYLSYNHILDRRMSNIFGCYNPDLGKHLIRCLTAHKELK